MNPDEQEQAIRELQRQVTKLNEIVLKLVNRQKHRSDRNIVVHVHNEEPVDVYTGGGME
jgi:hypothetical protein